MVIEDFTNMWEKIKKILSKEGGKCIIIEDNQPSYLVMRLDDYEKQTADSSSIEKINRDLTEWSVRQQEEEKEKETENPEVEVENLPF